MILAIPEDAPFKETSDELKLRWDSSSVTALPAMEMQH